VDTREKILALDELPALLNSDKWVIAVGQFDPLTAVQAKRLAALATDSTKLLAIVLEDGRALLPASARAALIAALRDVDAVTVAGPERWRGVIPNGPCITIVDDAEAEKIRSAEFVQRILERSH